MTSPPRSRTPSKRRRNVQEREPYDADAPIRTRSLTKTYGDLVAVDHLDLEVHAGEIFGLLGQNGAGKTTTILMLLGLTEPTAGTARVVGYDPMRQPLEVKRRVGYLPDAVGFYGSLTGRQNLRYTARLNGLPRAEAERRISAVLERVRMSDRADTRTDTYSRGMLQRLGIADALLKEPDVLILDEPTTAIDPIGVVEILDLLRELAHAHGIAILLSSHLLNQVQSTCDRIGIFAAGCLVGTGTVRDLAVRFGFSLTDLEVVLDLPAERDDEVAARLRGVTGIRDVALEVGGDHGRTWILTTDAARDVHATTREVIRAVEDLPLARIGQRTVALDSIYRLAVERRAEARGSAA